MNFEKLAKLSLEQLNTLKKDEARISFMVGVLTQVFIHGQSSKPRIEIEDGEVTTTVVVNSGSKKHLH